MEMTDKIKLIREKCIAANPKLKLRGAHGAIRGSPCPDCGEELGNDNGVIFCGTCPIGLSDKSTHISRPIRLADVLLAIPQNESCKAQAVSMNGDFFDFDDDMKTYTIVGSPWNLRADDLEKQSEETINFLYELLQ
jgi:hypothetical protein